MARPLSRGTKLNLAIAFAVGLLVLPFAAAAVQAMNGREAFEASVRRVTGSAFDADCRERRGVWRCRTSDTQGSGMAVYRIRRDGDCWRGRRTSPAHRAEGPAMPARVKGCVRLGDRLPFG